MGFKIKNSLTGEFEKLPILTLKGEKGETGGVEEYNKVDYMGNKYETLKQANDANVEYAVKTAIGEFNYLDYDGQHITATDTIEGRSKSAILSGNTLVNLFNVDDSLSVELSNRRWKYQKRVLNLIGGNKYYVYFFNKLNNLPLHIKPLNTEGEKGSFNVEANTGKVVTLDSTITNAFGYYYFKDGWTGEESKQDIIDKCKILFIEYREGMENWDIPYFEGMQSVKMPVLKTTGKNLFDVKKFNFNDNSDFTLNGNTITCKYTKKNSSLHLRLSDLNLKPNTAYRLSANCSANVWIGGMITHNSSWIWADKNTSSITFTTPNNLDNVLLAIKNINDLTSATISNIQLEEGSAATSYEPHKSNILTANEDVELRGIGDVKDELNVATGELTQRIDEIVLNGSQSRDYNYTGVFDSVYRIGILHSEGEETVLETQTIGCCDKLVSIFDWNGDYEHFYVGKSAIILFINKEKIGELNDENIKKYLQQNPITVQYQLATESIKTVDLSDNHVYSYQETTHYDCSSAEGSLVPTLSVKVPTDVQATIAQQRETIQTLNSENERLNQIQEALKASMLDSQVQLMNLNWNTDFEVFTLRESIAPKDFLSDSRTGSNIDKFSQAKFIIENDCQDLEKLNSQIEYYFSKDVFSQEQFEELTDLISIVKGENGCEY